MSGEAIRVAIIDDQRLFVEALAKILDFQPVVAVVGGAHTGEDAVELCLKEEPDVVLMDLSMQGMGGIDATRRIRTLLPRTQILVLTAHADDARLFRAIKAGAQGYILKDCTPDELTGAIRAVHTGHTIMSPAIADRTKATVEDIRSNAELAPSLTERELEVVRAMAQGKSNKEIAGDLGISAKTVRNHASTIYRKLRIFDRTQAVIYAVRHGLVDLDDSEFL